MRARTKRRIASGVLYGIVVSAFVLLVFAFVVLWQEKGAVITLTVIVSFLLAALVPIWLVEWAHAEDDDD